ncbi:hypothetical protein PhaeoP97_02493 [Phaeobacter porticola]|uniref:Uncharacterized protein n=2 Tax=Phaeobacter porticola TaxID=1844006 RepID=A0A1L3I6V3_9RHOB|nr:hypothetical protein PhaeoP97_02493 [Phaeobacter porticola]
MEFIEASDLSGASFDDGLKKLDARYSTMEPSRDTTEEKLSITIAERDFLLGLMRDEELVNGDFTKDGVSNLQLTYRGHMWLQEYRNNTFYKQAFRWLARQFDKVFSSIFLPVFTAILTVLVMQYLALSPQ